MKEIKVKLYSFDELSEDAKKTAIKEQREQHCDEFWNSVEEEIFALKDIANALGADRHIHYEFSTCSPSYISFSFGDYVNYTAGNLKDIRALKYIYNHFVTPFIKGKYYTIKHKYSQATFEFTPISGMYIDYIVLDVYKEYVDNTRKHIHFNVADFIDDVESRLAKTIVDNAEYNDNDDEWRERLQEDDSEIYTEDGTIY